MFLFLELRVEYEYYFQEGDTMFFGKLAMPHTTSGWIFIILLFVGVIIISMCFDNRFRRNQNDTNTAQLEKESLTTHNDNQVVYKKVNDMNNTSSVVKIAYENNHPISIEKTEIFTTKEGNIEESELRKRKQKLQKEVLDGVMNFDTVEYVDSSYHRDGEHLIGKAYMKQALNNDTNSETLIGLTLPFTKNQIEKKMIRDGYKKY